MAELTQYTKASTVKLTTTGRSSGQPRSVTIWFVVADANHVYVQHSSRAAAQWYKNLLKNPDVEMDFGDGSIIGRAQAVTDVNEIGRIQRLFRGKYLMAWIFQLLGWGQLPLVATIEV